MSLFTGMKIKQQPKKPTSSENQTKPLRQPPEVEIGKEDVNSSKSSESVASGVISSQFDFITAASTSPDMGQNPSLPEESLSLPQVIDETQPPSSDDPKGYLGTATAKVTTSIVTQGNALVDRIKKGLHIESSDDESSEISVKFSNSSTDITMQGELTKGGDGTYQKNLGSNQTDANDVSSTCHEGSTEGVPTLLGDDDSDLQHSLEYSPEERLQILKQGHGKRLKNIRAKKELLKNEVLKITSGRIQSILSLTTKHRELQELQTEQLLAIAAEDYEKADTLAKQCTALECELSILPDMSLNTHHIMEELLKSAVDLERMEHAASERMVREMRRLQEDEEALAERIGNRLAETEARDELDIEGRKLKLEQERSDFQKDTEEFKVQEALLEQKIAEGTQDHMKRKSELELEKENVEREIKKQEELLLKLRETNAELEQSIATEEHSIQEVMAGFRSEVDALEQARLGNQSLDGRIQEMRAELTTTEEKSTEQLRQYREQKERHEKLQKEVQELLQGEEKSHDLAPLDDDWSIQSPPSFNPTDGLTKAQQKSKDHEGAMRQTRLELIQGQKQVVALKKQVSDLEGHIAELEQSKKLAVEGKQYSEAKSLSDEIQGVTSEGQRLQQELEDWTKKNQETTTRLQEMQKESRKLKDTEEEEHCHWEEQLRDRLVSHFQTLYADRERALVKCNCAAAAILQSELQTSCLLLDHLCKKLTFTLSTDVQDMVDEILEDINRQNVDTEQSDTIITSQEDSPDELEHQEET